MQSLENINGSHTSSSVMASTINSIPLVQPTPAQGGEGRDDASYHSKVHKQLHIAQCTAVCVHGMGLEDMQSCKLSQPTTIAI